MTWNNRSRGRRENQNENLKTSSSTPATATKEQKRRRRKNESVDDFDQGTWMSLLGLMEILECFVTVDQTTLWQRHIAWANEGKDIREYNTKRFASNMVFFSLLLGSIMSNLINSAKFSTDMRQALHEQNYGTNKYWMGICLIVGAVVTVLGLVATYTAWGLLSAISDTNSHALLRSSMGQYVTSLPSKFVVASLYLYLTSLILFLIEIVSGPAMYALIFLVTALFFQVVVSLSAFGRLIIHTGAMGKRRVLDPQFERFLLPSGLHASLLIKATERRRRRTSVTSQYSSSILNNHCLTNHNNLGDSAVTSSTRNSNYYNQTQTGSHGSNTTKSIRSKSKNKSSTKGAVRRRVLAHQGSSTSGGGGGGSSGYISNTSLASGPQSSSQLVDRTDSAVSSSSTPLLASITAALVPRSLDTTAGSSSNIPNSSSTLPTEATDYGTTTGTTTRDRINTEETESILRSALAFSPQNSGQDVSTPSPLSSGNRSYKRRRRSSSRASRSSIRSDKNMPDEDEEDAYTEGSDHISGEFVPPPDDESVDDLVNEIRFPRPSVLNRTASNDLYNVVQMTLSQSGDLSKTRYGVAQSEEFDDLDEPSSMQLLPHLEEEEEDEGEENHDQSIQQDKDDNVGEHKMQEGPKNSDSGTFLSPVAAKSAAAVAAQMTADRILESQEAAEKRLQRQSVVAVYRRQSHHPATDSTVGTASNSTTKTSPQKKQQIRQEWQAEEDVRDMYGFEPPVDFLDEIISDSDYCAGDEEDDCASDSNDPHGRKTSSANSFPASEADVLPTSSSSTETSSRNNGIAVNNNNRNPNIFHRIRLGSLTRSAKNLVAAARSSTSLQQQQQQQQPPSDSRSSGAINQNEMNGNPIPGEQRGQGENFTDETDPLLLSIISEEDTSADEAGFARAQTTTSTAALLAQQQDHYIDL